MALAFIGRMARSGPPEWHQVPDLLRQIALGTLAPVLAVSAFIGATATLMGYHAFLPLGTQSMIGSFAGLVTVRELAPLLAGAMIAAKPGTATTAALATMRSSDQVDALEAMGVDPAAHLLWPRLLAFVLASVPLVVFADAAGLLTSFVTAIAWLGLSPATFMSDLLRFVGVRDLAVGLLKGLVFGILAGAISLHKGFGADRGPRGVSAAITQAMVAMAIADVLANDALSWLFYR